MTYTYCERLMWAAIAPAAFRYLAGMGYFCVEAALHAALPANGIPYPGYWLYDEKPAAGLPDWWNAMAAYL